MHKHKVDTAPTAGSASGVANTRLMHARSGKLASAKGAIPAGPPGGIPPTLGSLFELIQTAAQPMFIAWGMPYQIFYNSALCAALGLADQQEKTAYDLPLELKALEPILKRAYKGSAQGPRDIELRARQSDGNPITLTCSISCTPVFDDGDVAGIFCTMLPRHRSELTEELALQRAVAEATPECVKIVGADGRLVHMNAAGLRMVEASDEHDLYKGKVVDLIAPEHRSAWEENHRRVCNGERLTWEFDIIGLKGTRRRMETHAVPLAMPDGTTGQLAVTRDITARRKAEEALAESEVRFRELADNIPTLCWVAKADGHIYWYNRRWYDYTGADPESQEGWGWETVHDPEVLPEVKARWKQSIATGMPFEMVFPLRRADGVFRLFLTRIDPIRDESGAIVRWFGTNTDITRQRAAEAALRESEARFRNMADHAPVMIWTTDADGACTYLNRRWYEYTGRSSNDGDEACWLDHVHPDDRERAKQVFHAADNAHAPFRLEYRLSDAEGDYRWMIAAAAPRFSECGEFLGYVGTIIDIHERREAEKHLAFNEERLRLATDLGDIGNWDVDVVNNRLFWPPRVKAMFGISPDVPVTMSDFFECLHPEDREATIRAYTAACDPAVRALYDVEYRAIGKEDGIMRWVAAKGRGIFDESGRCTRVLGTAIDITQRRHKELELQQLNQDLEHAIAERTRERDRIWNVSQDLLVVTDGKGVWLNCNPAWEKAMGWKREDFIGRTSGWAEHPDDRVRTDKERYHLAAGGQTPRFENRFRHKDGTYRWLSWTAVSENGRIYAVARDVTAEREQAAKLSASENRFRAIFNSAFQFMALLDPQGTVLEVNETAMNWSAISPEDIVGQPFWLAAPMRDNPELQEAVKQEIKRAATGSLVRTEHEMRGAGDLKAIIDFSIKNVPGPDGRTAYLVAEGRDVTEMRRAQEQMRQTQKMEAVGQLTGGIAHDFNNLLQALQGCVEMIRFKPGDEAWVCRLADAALASTQRGVRLTSQLLAFSRAQELQLRPVVTDHLINAMTDLLTRTLGHNVTYKLNLHAGPTAVIADPTQLEMAILNLCINARDAMPEGGQLTISTEKKLATTNNPIHTEFVEIRVSDTGTGMPPEIVAKAFDPFFTTKKMGEGTGLGLSQVYGFVQQAGGSVRIESTVGKGTTVVICLRVTNEGESSEAGSVATQGTLAPTAANILIVDDDPGVRRFLSDCLETLGYAIRAASSGEEALTAVEQSVPDLLLLDFAMPGMTGAALASRIRAIHPHIPIIFASGYADTAELEEAAGENVVLLKKPFTVSALSKAIAESLSTRQNTGK